MNLSSTNKPNANFNMSSMTDLIFILLIFFLVTSSYKSMHVWDNHTPPSGKHLKEIFEENNQIFVFIRKSTSCDSYMYTIPDGSYCGWQEAEIALNNLIDLNQKNKPIIIVCPEYSTPSGEMSNVVDFAAEKSVFWYFFGDKKE